MDVIKIGRSHRPPALCIAFKNLIVVITCLLDAPKPALRRCAKRLLEWAGMSGQALAGREST
jgi:hypothetical protein